MELLNINKINMKIHTDSSCGKNMATRIGSPRKAKHIEPKHLLIQQLISHGYVRRIKIHTNDSPADILTKHVSTETLQRHLQQAGLGIQHLNLHWSHKQTVSPAACNKRAATPAFTAARVHQYIQVSLSSAMGSTILDQPFAVYQHDITSSMSTHFFIMDIFNMYGHHDGVHVFSLNSAL
jgi:hypothetical protein